MCYILENRRRGSGPSAGSEGANEEKANAPRKGAGLRKLPDQRGACGGEDRDRESVSHALIVP